jgi:hypothetical protein
VAHSPPQHSLLPDLSTLAGTIGAALSTRRQEFELQPIETRAPGEATTYLKVENPRFLFLEGLTDAVVAADVATAALPDASVARTTSSVDRLAAGSFALAPGTSSLAASVARGEGAQAPTSQRGPAPRRFLPLLPLPTTSTPRSPGRESLLLAQPVFLVPLFSVLPPPDPPLLLVPDAAPRARARARGVGGSDRTTFMATLC